MFPTKTYNEKILNPILKKTVKNAQNNHSYIRLQNRNKNNSYIKNNIKMNNISLLQ
jgi:translation initiation factor IF-1